MMAVLFLVDFRFPCDYNWIHGVCDIGQKTKDFTIVRQSACSLVLLTELFVMDLVWYSLGKNLQKKSLNAFFVLFTLFYFKWNKSLDKRDRKFTIHIFIWFFIWAQVLVTFLCCSHLILCFFFYLFTYIFGELTNTKSSTSTWVW